MNNHRMVIKSIEMGKQNLYNKDIAHITRSETHNMYHNQLI